MDMAAMPPVAMRVVFGTMFDNSSTGDRWHQRGRHEGKYTRGEKDPAIVVSHGSPLAELAPFVGQDKDANSCGREAEHDHECPAQEGAQTGPHHQDAES